MELKQLIERFTYRIEPKAEGGFIAHATDPSLPPIEAATRLELQEKIRQNIAARVASDFPGLSLPAGNQGLKLSLHIEKTPEGGFAIHSGEPGSQPIAAGHEEIESKFAEKLIGLAGKHLFPELGQALAAQGKAADIKVFVSGKTGFTVQAQSVPAGSDTNVTSGQAGLIQSDYGPTLSPAEEQAKLGASGTTVSNAPITPESSGSWKAFVVLGFIVVVAILYFFFHYR